MVNSHSGLSDFPANPVNLLSITSELRSILQFINNIADDAYIVGGFVRDHCLDRPRPQDMDIAVSVDGFELAKKVNAQFSGFTSFAPLDPVNGSGRLITKDTDISIIDISTMKGPSIHQDILRRDFTINSMAIKLADFLATGFARIIDPLNASEDISRRIVRVCAPDSFSDDPLRILRAYRFSAQLGFSIDPSSLSLVTESVPSLDEISGERLRDELFQILSCPNTRNSLVSMENEGIITRLFPQLMLMKDCDQNRYHSMDVWDHSLECVAQLDALLKCPEDVFGDFVGRLREYLDFEICPGRSRLWLIKIACIFHDSGKPHTRSVDKSGSIHFYGHEKVSVEIFRTAIERFRLSNRENDLVCELIRGHMRLASLTSVKPSRRFLYRVTERFGEDILGLLLIFISDLKSSCGPARTAGQLQYGINGAASILRYFHDIKPQPLKPLLNGHDIMNIFNIPQSPHIGKFLGILREKQALGEIASREQAIEEAGNIMKKMNFAHCVDK